MVTQLMILLLCTLITAEDQPVEATAFDGKPLLRPTLPAETLAKYSKNLEEAKRAAYAKPKDIDAHIWVGRRLAYFGRYQEAIKYYSDTIRRDPHDARIYRHRGHRFITTRQLERAIRDLERASRLMKGKPDQVEPDGLPNAAGIPTSTLHTNVWYHLGLARYLKGDYAQAVDAYRKCLAASKNDDMRVATLDWLYRALRRDGKHDEAKALVAEVKADTKLLESHDYHKLLLMYKGEVKGDDLVKQLDGGLSSATLAYGVANYLILEGKTAQGQKMLATVIEKGHWAAFGYIAAEADLARK